MLYEVITLEILYSFRRLNHRMHNKLLVVDGEWAILGGRNIGDAYFDLDPQRQFIDMDVLCRGAICPLLARGFISYWRSRWSHHWHRLHWVRPAARQLQVLRDALLQFGDSREAGVLPGCGQFEPQALEWFAVQARLLLDPPGKILHLIHRPSHTAQTLLSAFVITSYSIHYTKLYELVLALCQCFAQDRPGIGFI